MNESASCEIVAVGKSAETINQAVMQTPWETSGDSALFSLQEKARSEIQGKPYRKPTQVGWERILRRARERGSRNSAN